MNVFGSIVIALSKIMSKTSEGKLVNVCRRDVCIITSSSKLLSRSWTDARSYTKNYQLEVIFTLLCISRN